MQVKRNLKSLRTTKMFLVMLAIVEMSISSTAAQDVYVGGYVGAMGIGKPAVWKNEVPIILSENNGMIYSLVVDKGNVYAAGYEKLDTCVCATLWKDDVVLYSFCGGFSTTINSVAVSGNGSVYMSGEINGVGKVWKDSVEQSGYANLSRAYSIFISDEDVYVAGISTDIKAVVWKNGTELYTLTVSEYNYAKSVVVADDNVYTAVYGVTDEGYLIPHVFKNDTMLYVLDAICPIESSSYPLGLYVSDNGDIYMAGSDGEGWGNSVAKLWKNGESVPLDLGGMASTYAFSVFVSGDNVYVVGYEPWSFYKALLWKDGKLTTLPSNGGAYSVFVVKNGTNIEELTIENEKLRFYPNPTNDKFIVDFEGIATIKLYDLLGREVLTQTAKGKTEIEINHLPKGIYSVQILSEGRIIGNSNVVKQ